MRELTGIDDALFNKRGPRICRRQMVLPTQTTHSPEKYSQACVSSGRIDPFLASVINFKINNAFFTLD